MTRQYSPESAAPGSGDSASDYQLYIRTKQVEQAWLWASLKHTEQSGAVIRELEEEQGLTGKYERELPTEASTRSRMLRTIDRYFDPNGHIRIFIADWNPEALADQFLDRHREAMLYAIGQID